MQWISDSSDNRIFFNKRWLEFVGNDLDDERGCGWRRHVHAEDLKRYREVTETAFESHMPWHMEVRLKGTDGRYTRFFESAFPLFLADQSFIGYVGYCTDVNGGRVTSPKIPALNASMQTFNSLEMSPIGIINLDASMTVRNANKRISDLFGFPVNELVGRKISEILGAFDMTTLQVVLSRGEKIQLDNHRVMIETEKGESVRYWDISCWPQKDAGNNTTGICMSFIEATDRYTSVQQKEEFVAALVHDLKTPLIGAERTLDAMLKGALGPVESGHQHMLSVLQNSNRSLLTMVQSMIDMNRCESDILNLSLQSMKISALVRECAEELRVLFNSHGVQLKNLHDHKLEGIHVMGDRMALRRVILNLLDNALKFTPYSGTVTISLRAEGESIFLDISDTGIGIAEEEREKIFTKSFQGAIGKQMCGSAGIGLFVCRKIVRVHNGDITVTRNAMGGSTFTIELPRHAKDRNLVGEGIQPGPAETRSS
jgi:PAS domain S-box-containing protein